MSDKTGGAVLDAGGAMHCLTRRETHLFQLLLQPFLGELKSEE